MIKKTLSKLTQDPVEKSNVKSLSLNMMIKTADMPLFTGTEMQAFQVKLGLVTGQMGLIAALGQAASVVSYLLLIGVADRIKNKVRAYAILTIAMAFYPCLLVIISLSPEPLRQPAITVPIMAVGSIIECGLISFMALLFSTIFVRTISSNVRGRIMGLMGVGGGLLGVGTGYISSTSLVHLGYPYGFSVAFITATALLLVAGIVVRNVREIPALSAGNATISASPVQALKTVAKAKEFRRLILPNILRGVGAGAVFFAMAVAMKRLALGVEYAGYTTMCIFLGGMVGSAIVGFAADRFGAGLVLLVSNLCMAGSILGIVFAPSGWVFLLFFFLMHISFSSEGVAVPLAHYCIIPPQIIGAVSAVRLLMFNAIFGIAILANGYCIEIFDPLIPYTVSAICYVVAGLAWYQALNFNQSKH